MGLADRHYMREGPRRGPLSMTAILMIVLVVAFALQCINDVYLRTRAERLLALTTDGLRSGYLWQFITFQFLHGSFLHILFNLIGLYYFGHFAENALGRRRFLIAYFGAGVVGGLLQGVLMLLFPWHFGSALYGASAGVSGVFAIFAMLEGEAEVRWNFILPIRARTLLLIYGVVALFFTLVPADPGTAHAAHLGGLLAGVAWVKLGWHRDFVQLPWEGLFARWRNRRALPTRPRKNEFVKVASVRAVRWKNPKTEPQDLPPGEFISKEVDPILEKISAHGIHSLTERERKILEAARKKIAKR